MAAVLRVVLRSIGPSSAIWTLNILENRRRGTDAE